MLYRVCVEEEDQTRLCVCVYRKRAACCLQQSCFILFHLLDSAANHCQQATVCAVEPHTHTHTHTYHLHSYYTYTHTEVNCIAQVVLFHSRGDLMEFSVMFLVTLCQMFLVQFLKNNKK